MEYGQIVPFSCISLLSSRTKTPKSEINTYFYLYYEKTKEEDLNFNEVQNAILEHLQIYLKSI